MRISVALCTWNGERFLREQLDSLLAQTQLPDEVVAGDDASADGSFALLQAFAAQAEARGIEVDLRRNAANLGYVANFEAALRRTRGDLVFLCDQDDIWQPRKIERMAAEFAARPRLGLLHTDARLVDADGCDLGCGLFEALDMERREIEAEHRGDGFEVLLRRNTVTGATAAIRREALLAALPLQPGWVHDEWLALRSAVDWQVDCLEWASIGYRQHGGNQIGVRRRSLREKIGGDGRSKQAFMQDVAQRLEGFLARSDRDAAALSSAQREELQRRIAHAWFRATLPTSPFARARGVIGEACSGRYGRYSSGLRSIAGDLLDLKR